MSQSSSNNNPWGYFVTFDEEGNYMPEEEDEKPIVQTNYQLLTFFLVAIAITALFATALLFRSCM